MEFYLMRHGEAVSPGDWPRDDSSRPLTDLAQAQIWTAKSHMILAFFSPRLILTSPLVRAQQSADILRDLNGGTKVVVEPSLSAGASTNVFRQLLIKYKDETPLLFVGHMPDLILTAARVLSESAMTERSLKPGEMLAIETQALDKLWSSGKLLWSRTLEQWKGL